MTKRESMKRKKTQRRKNRKGNGKSNEIHSIPKMEEPKMEEKELSNLSKEEFEKMLNEMEELYDYTVETVGVFGFWFDKIEIGIDHIKCFSTYMGNVKFSTKEDVQKWVTKKFMVNRGNGIVSVRMFR